LTSSCCYRLLVRSADVRFVPPHPPQVVVLILRSSSTSVGVVGSSHVYFRPLNLSGEFRFSIYRVQHRSHPMFHCVVLTRCSELSSVAGSSHVPSFTAPLWSASGHSLGNVFDVVSVRPSPVEMALS